jgi:hypothetical protein
VTDDDAVFEQAGVSSQQLSTQLLSPPFLELVLEIASEMNMNENQ